MTTKNARSFVLGAGLGTRLRPLTENLPKPLVPVRGRPLVTHALDHLASDGVRQVVINTHHAAARWQEAFPSGEYPPACGGEKVRITFRHEPVLLDTGGGLKNVEDLFRDAGTFLIYNADILTSLPLEKAREHHRRSRNLVTLVLRSHEQPRHVALAPDGAIRDIRGLLGTGAPGQYVFTGIHVAEPEIFRHIPDARPRPIIPIYLDLIRQGLKIGGVVVDEGEWSDVGTLDEYRRLGGALEE